MKKITSRLWVFTGLLKPSLRGQLLVELLLAMGIAVVIFPGIVVGLMAARDGKAQQGQRFQAVVLMKEAHEALRSIREQGWSNIPTSGTYYPQISAGGSTWQLASGSATSNGFVVSMTFSDVYRNTNAIVLSPTPGTVDPSTRRIVISVSWTSPISSSITDTVYLTRHESLSSIQTSQSDFNAGTKTNTYAANTGGGEIVLGAGGGGGDWCAPSYSITQYDLPKSGVANAITAIEGRIFTGTGENASGVSFADVSLTTNVDPPQVLNSKTSDGYKTNAVFGEANFAYLATDNNSKEFVMIDLNQYSDPPTNLKYKEVGSINLSGNGNGNNIYVVNNKAYVTDSNKKFYIYNLSMDRTSATLQNAGGYTLSGNGKKVIVGASGQYAYVITDATTNQFEIINISNAANPTRTSIKTLGTSQTGVDLAVTSSESTVYAAISYSSGKNNIYKIDISTKSNPQVGSGYSTNGMSPKAINVVTGNRAIIVGTGGTYQYQVIDTNTMAMCGANSGLTYSSGVNGVASVLQANGYAYSYIITGDSSSELKIILGGAGGQYVTSGTFVSSVISPGVSTAFNRFEATVSSPSQTDIKLQVAVANKVGGSCTNATYTFVGPNGDPSQYFTVGSDPTRIIGTIPLITSGSYSNPGECFKYKALLSTTDSTASPVIYDMTVNYSP
jgi:hypothetical protein